MKFFDVLSKAPKNLLMNTAECDEKIFIPVMHKKHEIYIKM